MRILLLLLALTINIGLFAQSVTLSESKVEWYGDKPGKSHNGTIDVSEYDLNVQEGSLVGSFTMDLKTITSTDLKGLYKGQLEKHLRSKAFFDAKKHPTASFELISTTDTSLIGNLTIKGITKKIEAPADIKIIDGKVTAVSDIEFDRTEFNVMYNDENLVDKLKDKIVYNTVKIKVSLVGNYK